MNKMNIYINVNFLRTMYVNININIDIRNNANFGINMDGAGALNKWSPKKNHPPLYPFHQLHPCTHLALHHLIDHIAIVNPNMKPYS